MGSDLPQQAFQTCHDLPPVLNSVEDGVAAPSAMHLCDEDSPLIEPFSEEKEGSTSKLVADDNSLLDIQEVNVDGLGQQVLEASKKLDHTLRKAFLQAIEMHTGIVRAFLYDRDRADPRATAKFLSPLQKLLVSFRRQVIQGIQRLLVPLMLAVLDIVNHILIQLLPTDTELIHEVEGNPLAQKAVSFRILDSDTAGGSNHDKAEVTRDCDFDGEFVNTSSQIREQVFCLNPGAPVELASGFDRVITTDSSNEHGGESAEDGIESELSIATIDAIEAVSGESTNEGEDTEFSFEMIDIDELNGFKV